MCIRQKLDICGRRVPRLLHQHRCLYACTWYQDSSFCNLTPIQLWYNFDRGHSLHPSDLFAYALRSDRLLCLLLVFAYMQVTLNNGFHPLRSPRRQLVLHSPGHRLDLRQCCYPVSKNQCPLARLKKIESLPYLICRRRPYWCSRVHVLQNHSIRCLQKTN